MSACLSSKNSYGRFFKNNKQQVSSPIKGIHKTIGCAFLGNQFQWYVLLIALSIPYVSLAQLFMMWNSDIQLNRVVLIRLS